MRIMDWSSDVCSSDLMTDEVPATGLLLHGIMHPLRTRKEIADAVMPYPAQIGRLPVLVKMFLPNSTGGHRCSQQALIDGCNDRTPGIGSNSIGRASCRERVCKYV